MTALDEAVEQLLDQRVAQGLPRTISDPAVVGRIARIVRTDLEIVKKKATKGSTSSVAQKEANASGAPAIAV